MNFLASKQLSLICAIVNIWMAFASLVVGAWGWAIVSGLLAAFCYNNYRNGGEQ
jgi:hypothetical protein